ncbi:MAG: RidA family protein [Solirubrobacterales bacterium]|nr:RidA family protein [Solirubrobacterales bacterium]
MRSGAPSPWVGVSEMAAQTRAVLDSLAGSLEEAGSSIDRVLKTEVYLADPADFAEFKRVYAEVFSGEPPARTTIVVGEEHIVDGALLNLQAVALTGDSELERRVILAEGVPDPVAAEHASLAVSAGPFVFCSGFPATDFETGLAVGRTEGFPYYGTDVAMQARYVLDNLARVLEAAGSSPDQGLKVQFYSTSLLDFSTIDGAWADYVGEVAPTRSSMGCRGFVVPGALWAPNLLALVPGNGIEKQETREGIAWHPVDAGKATFSPGVTAGPWLFTSGQIPVPDITKHEWVGAPAGLPHHWSEIELQADYTLDLLQNQLEANGAGFDDVVDARIYLVDPRRDFRGFARAWERRFADVDPKPAMGLVPSKQADGSDGVMVSGPQLEIDLTTLRGRASQG